MKLVMTLLVRDEEDIIQENIDYHLAQGVDFFIATDNKSVDSTKEILKSYEKLGLLHYIYKNDDTYNQHAWVTKMARMAYVKFQADWVINNDADEFWIGKNCRLSEIFDNLASDIYVVRAERHNFAPVEIDNEPFWSRMVYRELQSLNALGAPLPLKVAHRGSSNVQVEQGNHEVSGLLGSTSVDGVVEIMHFPVRSRKQIENKISKGGLAYSKNTELPVDIGETWRVLYEKYRVNQDLKEYYTGMLRDDHQLKTDLENGKLFLDTRLREFFSERLPRSENR